MHDQDIEHQHVIFVLAILYSLPEKWRGMHCSRSFEYTLNRTRGVSLHSAFYRLKQENLLGTFSREFTYDTLHGSSNIELVLSIASRDGLVRLDGTHFAYHLDEMSDRTVELFMRQHKIDPAFIARVAERLAELLEEQEIKVAGTPHRSR